MTFRFGVEDVRIGVEEEFHVIDIESGQLVPRAAALLRAVERYGDTFTGELSQSVVESNSGVHATLDGLFADLTTSRTRLDHAAAAEGLAVAAAGTAPRARLGAVPSADDDPRYTRMADDYRRLVDEQLICGVHVHADVPDRDTAVHAMCVVAPWVPVLLALSASSPYWLGADTGYASWRTMIWQRWPTAGPPGCFSDAAAYDRAVRELIGTGVISDPGMIYYDVRPSAHLPTLELRVCDACPRVETVVLIAALYRALVTHALTRLGTGEPGCDGNHAWLRAATWRAARSGLEGDLIDPETRRAAPASAVVRGMVRRLRPALEAHGDWAAVRSLTEEALSRGSAAERLRSAVAGEDLLAGVDQLLADTRGRARPAARPARHAAGTRGPRHGGRAPAGAT